MAVLKSVLLLVQCLMCHINYHWFAVAGKKQNFLELLYDMNGFTFHLYIVVPISFNSVMFYIDEVHGDNSSIQLVFL